MKFFLVLSVIALAAFASAEDFPLPTEAQVECIIKLVRKTVDENSGLEKWHAETTEAFKAFSASAEKCKQLSGAEQKACLDKVKTQIAADYKRLLQELPESLRAQFDNGFKTCLQ